MSPLLAALLDAVREHEADAGDAAALDHDGVYRQVRELATPRYRWADNAARVLSSTRPARRQRRWDFGRRADSIKR